VSGYSIVIGACINCRRTFGFNPYHVPSLVIDGQREPLCRDCFARWCELHPELARPLHPEAYEPIEGMPH
jgi:hypothetical protein